MTVGTSCSPQPPSLVQALQSSGAEASPVSLVPSSSENHALQPRCCCSIAEQWMTSATYQLLAEVQVGARHSGILLEQLCFLHQVPGRLWLHCLRHHPLHLLQTGGNQAPLPQVGKEGKDSERMFHLPRHNSGHPWIITKQQQPWCE